MAEEEGFTVRDRRRRPPEGAEAPEAPGRAPVAGPGPEGGPAPAQARAPAEAEPPPEPLDLRAVFMMFASSALAGLGEAEDPVTGQRHVDLGQAEQAIDALILLRDKTEGNRTEEESAFLEDVLYDLEVRFVQATQALRP
jgi:hypothetical protein